MLGHIYILTTTHEKHIDIRHGLSQLYIGPESGDDVVLKRIAKGSTAADHAQASQLAREAGMKQSVIFLLGAGGIQRSQAHAEASAELATAMDPEFLSALTLTIVPNTPLARQAERNRFELPDVMTLLGELRTFIAGARPTDAVFRTNHASNYLPIAGRLPVDGPEMVSMLDLAIEGALPLHSAPQLGEEAAGVALVLGNEVTGVDASVLAACDAVVEVPVFGVKNSLNVACCASIALYEVLRRWGKYASREPNSPGPDQ